MSTFFAFFGSIAVFVVFIVLIMWRCALVGLVWTFVGRNRIILTDKGKGNPHKVLFHSGRKLGIQWMGLPPVEIHEFPLKHRRLNKEITKETPHHNWLVGDDEPEMETFLLETVTHWTYVPGFEFNGGQRADILFQYQATVAGEDGARTAVYDREGTFYEILDSVIESNTISLAQLRGMSYDTFMGIEKDENSPLMNGDATNPDGLLQEVNKTADKRSGYKLDSIFIYRFDASSQTEQELALEKKKAEIHAEATKIRAKGDVADITEIIALIKERLPHADDTEILREVTKLGMAKRISESTSLQAVGGAMLGIQPNSKSGGKGKK